MSNWQLITHLTSIRQYWQWQFWTKLRASTSGNEKKFLGEKNVKTKIYLSSTCDYSTVQYILCTVYNIQLSTLAVDGVHYDQLTCPAPLAENALMHSDTAICKYEQHILVHSTAQVKYRTPVTGNLLWNKYVLISRNSFFKGKPCHCDTNCTFCACCMAGDPRACCHVKIMRKLSTRFPQLFQGHWRFLYSEYRIILVSCMLLALLEFFWRISLYCTVLMTIFTKLYVTKMFVK